MMRAARLLIPVALRRHLPKPWRVADQLLPYVVVELSGLKMFEITPYGHHVREHVHGSFAVPSRSGFAHHRHDMRSHLRLRQCIRPRRLWRMQMCL